MRLNRCACLWRGPGQAAPAQAGCRGLSREPCSVSLWFPTHCLGLPASSPHCQEPGASTWRCSREAGILQASAREGSLLMAGLRCSRTSTWAERSAGPRTRWTLRLDFPPALQCSLHPPDPWVESGRSSGIPAAKAPWMSLPATHPSGPDQILCSP